MRKSIFFDYDGVIVDSIGISTEGYNMMLKHYGKPANLTVDIVRKNWGHGWRGMYTKVMGIKEEDINEASKARGELMMKSGLTPEVFKGMKEVVADLAKDFDLYIISSSNSKRIIKTLNTNGMDKYFKKVYAQDNLKGIYKPDPQYLLVPMKELGLNKENVIVIGDGMEDIHGAHAAGLKVIACSWGWQFREVLMIAKPNVLVDTPKQLEEAVRRIF